jgi:protein-tyrosine-phosphatase
MRYVLFACTHNAGRSQIAQAFFERYVPAESAGQEPAAEIWPAVIEAMREVGIDISDRKPKKIELEMQLRADKAITLNCQSSCPYVLTRKRSLSADARCSADDHDRPGSARVRLRGRRWSRAGGCGRSGRGG